MARRNEPKPIAAFICFSLYFFYFLQKSGNSGPPAKKVWGLGPPASPPVPPSMGCNHIIWSLFSRNEMQRNDNFHGIHVIYEIFHFVNYT